MLTNEKTKTQVWDLSIAIQHIPDRADRREWVRTVVEQIRRESPSTTIEVVEDPTRQGPWSTHRRALERSAASHHLVLQDDVQLCRDFVLSALAAIAARPHHVICPYNHSETSLKARANGFSWMRTQHVWGPAAIWPRALIDPFLDWERAHVDPDFRDDDIRVSMWLHKENTYAFAMIPSIVQHLGESSSSIRDGPGRMAQCFVGAQDSGTEIDWEKDLDHGFEVLDDRVKDEYWCHFRE